MLTFQNNRAIILHFPRYSGGKFISNCLSLSRHACPQHAKVVEHLIKNPMDYQYRFDKIMQTIPPKHDAHHWIEKYEFGDRQIFGPAASQWRNGIPDVNITDQADSLIESSMHFFLTSHTHPANILLVWPRATVITLVNHTVFGKISRRLKSKLVDNKNHAGNYCREQYELLSGESWPPWNEFESSGYNAKQFASTCLDHIIAEMLDFYPEYRADTTIIFNIDDCIFNQYKFLEEMEKLYQKLNFDDFDPALTSKFWQAYMDIHIDKSQNL